MSSSSKILMLAEIMSMLLGIKLKKNMIYENFETV